MQKYPCADKYNEQTKYDLENSIRLIEGKMREEEKKKTVPFYLIDINDYGNYYDEVFFKDKLSKEDFKNICKEISFLLSTISNNRSKVKLDFKTKKTIKFALFLLIISTFMLFFSVKVDFEQKSVFFLIAFGIGLFSVLMSFISSLFDFFNIPSLEKCSNPMYGKFLQFFTDLNKRFADDKLEFIFHMQIQILDIIKK
jgi:hypothetical protein